MISWLGLKNFLMEFYQFYGKLFSSKRFDIFYLFKKAKNFCGKKVSIEEF